MLTRSVTSRTSTCQRALDAADFVVAVNYQLPSTGPRRCRAPAAMHHERWRPTTNIEGRVLHVPEASPLLSVAGLTG